MEFPRLQLTFLSAFLLVVQLSALELSSGFSLLLVSLTATCLVWQLWWILPYTRLWPHEVKPSPNEEDEHDISILTANVLMSNRDADALISLVRDVQPDILVTLESDQWWQDQLDVVEDVMPYTVKCPLDNLYGMHVYSRLPIVDPEIAFLVEDDVPSIHGLVSLEDGQPVQVHFLHPAPPSPTENEESSERDAELVVVARSVMDSTQPVIVTGDLNDVAWSATTRLFRKLSGLLDPRIGRGMFNTFHAGIPIFRWPLDHLFHSNHFTLRSIERLPAFGSDHFALHTRLSYAPGHGVNEQGLELTSSDKALADEIADNRSVESDHVPSLGARAAELPCG